MHSLRRRLIAAFVAATVLPLGATIWITTSLLDRSLDYATTADLERLTQTLEATARQLYQRERDALRANALAGRIPVTPYPVGDANRWPASVRGFWESKENERFSLSETETHLDFLRRQPNGVDAYGADLSDLRLRELTTQLAETRARVGAVESRDLRRGFTLTLLLLVAATWLISLVPVLIVARRISTPIQQLTSALSGFAAGDESRRLERRGGDEVGQAVEAFNAMADQLQRNRERLVYLTQMSSWQSLARKTAHELKNSLTPIRLTVEEIAARQPNVDRAFMDEAARIVVAEIEALEQRLRAFSEFAEEPTVRPTVLDVNTLVLDRVGLLRSAHPETTYSQELDERCPRIHAGADEVNGILTNLLENAAEAAGAGGTVLVATRVVDAHVDIDVHDSGPGLSDGAAATLFEPTISFKKHGMGLGLSIARKQALLSGGDIARVPSELGGAGFRVTLPLA